MDRIAPRPPILGESEARDPWRVYRRWFWAATVYNVVWGAVVGLKPTLMLGWMGMTAAQQAVAGSLPGILSACIGMFVGVYAIGYACVALDPARFWPFALLGLCGKVLGPAGWALHHALGHLPWPSLWVNVFNDLIWWPAFFGLLIALHRAGVIRADWVQWSGRWARAGAPARPGQVAARRRD